MSPGSMRIVPIGGPARQAQRQGIDAAPDQRQYFAKIVGAPGIRIRHIAGVPELWRRKPRRREKALRRRNVTGYAAAQLGKRRTIRGKHHREAIEVIFLELTRPLRRQVTTGYTRNRDS